MAFEAVDACFGTPHISSDDLAALNEATIGKRDCVMKWGDDFKAVMTNANTCLVGTGVGMVGGKRFWNQAAVSLTVQGGTQGQKRNDLVVARYAKTSAGIESITPVVIKGTPVAGEPADPATAANDLKLWRIPLDGINAGDPVRLFEPVAPLASCGEVGTWSATVTGGTGTIDVTCVNHIGVARVSAWPRGGDGSWAGDRLSNIELDERFRPKTDYAVPAWGANRTGEGDVVLKVNADGTFAWQAQGGSQADEPLYGVLVWAY